MARINRAIDPHGNPMYDANRKMTIGVLDIYGFGASLILYLVWRLFVDRLLPSACTCLGSSVGEAFEERVEGSPKYIVAKWTFEFIITIFRIWYSHLYCLRSLH